ncbi:MAG: hypothetical protein U0Y68_15940 [Blastocatellia bacterium]
MICFAVFGSVSAMMPLLKKNLGLSPVQVSIALAVPVPLGSLGRIPLGMLDGSVWRALDLFARDGIFGGACVFDGLCVGYTQLVLCGFFIGVALASFSVGVGVSQRLVSAQEMLALGVYGAGNIGQSLAGVFGSPVLAGALGMRWGRTFGVLLLIWLAVFWLS